MTREAIRKSHLNKDPKELRDQLLCRPGGEEYSRQKEEQVKSPRLRMLLAHLRNHGKASEEQEKPRAGKSQGERSRWGQVAESPGDQVKT